MAINPKAWHLHGTGLLELATIDQNDEPQYRKQEFGWRPLYDPTAVGDLIERYAQILENMANEYYPDSLCRVGLERGAYVLRQHASIPFKDI